MSSKTYSRGANHRRGEILAELGGQKHILVLTLGALAELEDTLNCTSLQQLTERFTSTQLKAADIIKVLGAGLRGGGLIIENEEVAELSHEGGVAALAKLAGELLVATFSPQQAEATSKQAQS
ncbi:Gene transfer agent (GTA) like protein [Pseudovibrio sp. FO-BEG1]|uniref:gene transfer agent family protein n=1 Tax=Pseudovibrio sp. (strain FO-BEG1) TaxID=911045 RepID=UPI000238D1BA|nr:gene transfer agent family protein [Pseudovibrio sp. FO-BEG1]AEV36975.1 Gene transfer agent (GTA) like protein [Pseudovibrio sp. FO-BEG1]